MCLLTIERVSVPHYYGKLLESIKRAKFDEATTFFIIVISIFFVFQVLDTLLTYIDAKLMPYFEAYVRQYVTDTIIDRYEEQYTELDLGNITSKLIKLPSNLNYLFYKVKAFLFNHVLSIVITAGYLFYCHPILGGIFTCAFAVVAFITWGFCCQCSAPSYKRQEAFDSTQESIQDILSNLQSVYIHQTKPFEQKNIDHISKETIRHTQNYVFCGLPYRIVFALLFICVFAAITWMSISLYRQKKMSLATLVSSFMVTFSILRTCISFYFDFETFIYLYGGIQVVADYLHHLPTPSTSTTHNHTLPHTGTDIEVRDVVYHTEKNTSSHTPTTPLLNHLSLTIGAGEHVAITGNVGSGKSTLAHLLLRLRRCQEGKILFNNIDIADISISSLRSTVHYVPQQPRLFHRTLWENISYGNDELTIDEVYRLLDTLQLDDVNRVFRRKMHKSVGKHGSELSGGQRQIVFLMRAMFNKHCSVLILDEPTASLDTLSRNHVIQLIQSMSSNKTLIVITHDNELARLMHRTLHLENGTVNR